MQRQCSGNSPFAVSKELCGGRDKAAAACKQHSAHRPQGKGTCRRRTDHEGPEVE